MAKSPSKNNQAPKRARTSATSTVAEKKPSIRSKREQFVERGDRILEIASPKSGKRLPDRKYKSRYLEVLAAAAKLFAKKGYHSATTADIADELGVHQASLYYYIKSKEQALDQICEVAIEGYVNFSEEIKNSSTSHPSKVRELIHAHLLTLNERPSFFKVFQENRKDMGAMARHRIGRKIRTYEKNVELIIQSGMAAKIFRENINALHATMALISVCNSVGIWWQVRSNDQIENVASDLADIFVAGLVSNKPGKPSS